MYKLDVRAMNCKLVVNSMPHGGEYVEFDRKDGSLEVVPNIYEIMGYCHETKISVRIQFHVKPKQPVFDVAFECYGSQLIHIVNDTQHEVRCVHDNNHLFTVILSGPLSGAREISDPWYPDV